MATKRTPVKAVDTTAASSKVIDSLAAGTTLVHEIPIDRIDPHPKNPRRDLGDLGELAESIRAHGVRQPATVVLHPDTEGRYLTVMGHRRIAAAVTAGRTTVPAIVDEMSETEQLEMMLVENLQRQDLTISEEGAGYQGLLDLGVPKAMISRRTGRAKNTVDTRLRIAGLPEPVRRHVDHHQLTIDDALAFAEWKNAYPDVWEDQLEKLSNPHVMVDVVMGEAKRVVTERQALVKARTDLEAAGYKLIVAHKMIPYGDPRSISRLGISYTEHAHCPGAEVHITGSSKDWYENALRWGTHLCADIEKHHPDEYAALPAPAAAGTETGETDQQKQWREERERREAEREARAAVAGARRTWLVQTLTRQGKDAAPAYAALADCAAQVAVAALSADPNACFYYGMTPGVTIGSIADDLALPTNPLALLTLTMLLSLDAVLPEHPSRLEADDLDFDLQIVVAYLTTCAEHGHELHESEQALIDAAKAALEAQALAAETEAPVVDDGDPNVGGV
jgi:ParB family chromosome partitioning protein